MHIQCKRTCQKQQPESIAPFLRHSCECLLLRVWCSQAQEVHGESSSHTHTNTATDVPRNKNVKLSVSCFMLGSMQRFPRVPRISDIECDEKLVRINVNIWIRAVCALSSCIAVLPCWKWSPTPVIWYAANGGKRRRQRWPRIFAANGTLYAFPFFSLVSDRMLDSRSKCNVNCNAVQLDQY